MRMKLKSAYQRQVEPSQYDKYMFRASLWTPQLNYLNSRGSGSWKATKNIFNVKGESNQWELLPNSKPMWFWSLGIDVDLVGLCITYNTPNLSCCLVCNYDYIGEGTLIDVLIVKWPLCNKIKHWFLIISHQTCIGRHDKLRVWRPSESLRGKIANRETKWCLGYVVMPSDELDN